MRLKLLFLFSVLGGMVGLLGYVAYHQFYQRGLQAEAKLMMSYVHTLQRVYRLENGRYVAFGPYGAAHLGQDLCAQPEAAAELGFLLPGCHKKGALPPRYTYTSNLLEGEKQYLLRAESGSDVRGRSFVCFGEDGSEVWESSKNLSFLSVSTCW